jgi:flagellar motor component MotA
MINSLPNNAGQAFPAKDVNHVSRYWPRRSLCCVFGVFAMTGGALGPVFEAIPHEVATIGGAGIAALIIGNDMHGLKALGAGFAKCSKVRAITSRTILTSSP